MHPTHPKMLLVVIGVTVIFPFKLHLNEALPQDPYE
jgi:hypothetical protein